MNRLDLVAAVLSTASVALAVVGCGSSDEVVATGGAASASTTTTGAGGAGGAGVVLRPDAGTTTGGGGFGVGGAPGDVRFWAVVHPTHPPATGAGIYLFDETTGVAERRIPFPADAASPHGLAFDGRSLWLSSGAPTSQGGRVYEIDPASGDVRGTFDFPGSEGLARAGDDLWTCPSGVEPGSAAYLWRVTTAGETVQKIPVQAPTIQDCTTDGTWLYYLVNASPDVVYRVDPATGEQTTLIGSAGPGDMAYSLTWDGESLVVVDGYTISRFDAASGAAKGSAPWKLPGWTTAIAPVRVPGT
jgi:hypothetical protein